MGGARSTLFATCLCCLLILYCVFGVLSLSAYTLLTLLVLACILFIILIKLSVPACRTVTILSDGWVLSGDKTTKEVSQRKIKVVAHRACGLDAPENSMVALKKVIHEEITAVEFDIILTSDDVPIVFHDETLSRMTGDSRRVDSVTYAELSSLDISVMHPFGKKYSGESIPTLKQYIECCIQNNICMFMDLKSERLVPHIVKAFEEYPELENLSVITSFDPILIYKIRSLNPKITGCLAWRPYYWSYTNYSGLDGPQDPRSSNVIVHLWHRFLDVLHDWSLCYFVYYLVGISVILLDKDAITRDAIEYWKKRDVQVFAWTVNLPSEKKFFEKSLQVPYLTDTVITS